MVCVWILVCLVGVVRVAGGMFVAQLGVGRMCVAACGVLGTLVVIGVLLRRVC